MVREQSFSGLDSESPYIHLREFEQLCSCLVIPGMTRETLKWKLFPFSLKERAKQWYTHSVGSVNGQWSQLRDKFCLAFFPLSRIASLRREILGFQQSEKESIGAAWSRFSLLTQSGPDLSIPEPMLLEHFFVGLDKESALHLDATAGGSFLEKTTIEGREILDRILDNFSFTSDLNEPIREEAQSSSEDPSIAESSPKPSTSLDSTIEPSTEPHTQKGEEIPISEFPFGFEDDAIEHFRNTSNYFFTQRPPDPVPPPDPLKGPCLKKSVKELSSFASTEFLRKDEHSPQEIQICSPSSTIQCYLKGTKVDVLYNPTVGANIMSDSCALAFLGDEPLVPTDRFFRNPSGLLSEPFGIIRNIPLGYKNGEVVLDFHIFEVHDFDILIGHPIETESLDVPTLGIPDLACRRDDHSVPTSRLKNPLTDHPSKTEPLEEVRAVFLSTSPESIQERDTQQCCKEEEHYPHSKPTPPPPPDPLQESVFKVIVMEQAMSSSEDWTKEVKRSSCAIQINSPSTSLPCSVNGTAIEALHNPILEANIMAEYLADTLLGNMPLEPSDQLFKSPSGLIFECRGIARGIPIVVDKIKVHLDFHIFAILDFDLLLGFHLESLCLVSTSQASLNQTPRKTSDPSPASLPSEPLVDPSPKHTLLDETFFVDMLHEKKNILAMEFLEGLSLESEGMDSTDEHESFFIENPQDACSFEATLEQEDLCAKKAYEDYNLLKALTYIMFVGLVVDAFVYHKYCKSRIALWH